MVTIKDLARQLNLHHTTVSKALRDHPDIKKETKDKVKALAKELDYFPNALAQSFKRRSSSTIGIIVPNINVDFFSTVISAIEDVLYDAGFTIMISQSNESLAREEMIATTMLSHQVAGLIMSASVETHDISHLKSFNTHDIPIVFFDRVIPDSAVAKVVVDDYKAAFELTEYLITRGYKKLAHLGASKIATVSVDRRQGFIDAQKKYNIPILEHWITEGGFREHDGYINMSRLLEAGERPSAVFAVNDQVAFGAYKAVKKYDLKIPDDIAVAGFGNLELAEYMDPPLTTVAQEPALMGKTCAELLLSAIQEPRENIAAKKIIIPTSLMIKGST